MSWTVTPRFTYSSAFWSPANITTALWLDAADAGTVTTVSGAVSQWNDKSGNSRNFSQSTVSARPTLTLAGLNNRNVITFGSGLFIGAATASDWGFMHGAQSSVIGVASPSSTASPGTNQTILATRASGANAGCMLIYRDVAPTYDENFSHRVINATASAVVEGDTGNNTHPVATAATIYSVLSDPTNATASSRSSIRFNGGNAFETNIFTNTATSPATSPQFALRLGAETSFMTGYWAEIIITSSLISNANRQRAEGYLAWKWGLVANLPSTHPFKNSPPMP